MVHRRPANARGWRLLVATFTLIAFALQGYFTQTHIHVLQRASVAVAQAAGAAASRSASKNIATQRHAPVDKAPANEEPVKCPLCQAVGYAGHFVTPSAAASLLLPIAAISILPLTLAIVSRGATPSYIWHGRGPPNS